MSGKFYTISQNNSGGYFIENDDVDYYVSVQADSLYEAEKLLEDIVEDYSEYCDCCGLRWTIWLDKKGIEYNDRDNKSTLIELLK